MAEKIVIEAEVKSNIGDVSKDAKSAAGEFQVMGVSLNSVKAGFVSAGNSAKVMFGSIKAGIMSTGIGALLIAFGSLATFFTSTEKGAERLKVILSGISATFNVLRDRISTVGESLTNVFNQSLLTTLKQIGNAFSGISTEIKEDVTSTMELTKRTNELVDAERKLNVETAQKRARIEELKLIAEDVTKEEGERLAAAKVAFKMEQDLLDARVKNAEEAVNIQKDLNSISKSGEEDLDALAEKEIALANIRAESATKQIELNNKINAIKAEIAAQEQEDADAFEALQIAQANAFEKRVNKELEIAKKVKDAKIGIAKDGLNLISAIAEEGSTIGKAAAVASATISGVEGVQNAFTTAQKSPLTALMPAYPFIQAGLAGAFSAIQIQKILSGTPAVGGGGGGATAATPATPAPQMMSGAFELSGGVEPEPTRAYVVTDEMTNSQNQLANIRRRATI